MHDNKHNWTLNFKRFFPEEERLRESLCTLGNGYFGTRGAAPEATASEAHYPGTYVAGLFNRLSTHIAGRKISNEDFVNCPNWLFLTFKNADDSWFNPSITNIISYDQTLDMRQGVLIRRIKTKNKKGQITVLQTKMVIHMKNPHLGLLQYCITPKNYSGEITIRSMLDGSIENKGVPRYSQLSSKHWKIIKKSDKTGQGLYLLTQTSQSKIKLAQASKMRAFCEEKELRPERYCFSSKETVGEDICISAEKNKTYVFEKTVALYDSNNCDTEDPLRAALCEIKKTKRFNDHLKPHIEEWEKIWDKVDIQIEGDEFVQKALRLHMFHLIQTASPNTIGLDAGVPARGLHGEAYRGHIFWDELFIMPFYDLHFPKISRSLLLYRYKRLPAARQYAKKYGYQGAMYPWQSGSSGKEETQELHLNPKSGQWGPDHSRLQRHVSLAIAYNVWEYYKRSDDLRFLSDYGAEMILSIAQFFASLVYFDENDCRYHTKNIMGPDEFHEKMHDQLPGLKDNAYTNLLICWLFLRSFDIITLLSLKNKKRIFRKIGLKTKDIERWHDIARKMFISISDDGIVAQFDGYFSLKELDWQKYRKKYADIHRLDRILKAEGKSPNDYKIAKQADFLMIFYLLPFSEIREIFRMLGYSFTINQLRKNYDYYLQRTSHGSTLSKVVHCFIANMLKEDKIAQNFYLDVLKSDIYDIQGGTTAEGIHTGVMGGSINIAIRGFAGVNALKDELHIFPSLSDYWKKIEFKLLYRKKWISFVLTRSTIDVFVQGEKKQRFAVPIRVRDKLYYCHSGKQHRIKYRNYKTCRLQ